MDGSRTDQGRLHCPRKVSKTSSRPHDHAFPVREFATVRSDPSIWLDTGRVSQVSESALVGDKRRDRAVGAGSRHAKLALGRRTCNWRQHATHDVLTKTTRGAARSAATSLQPDTLIYSMTNLGAPIAFLSARTGYTRVVYVQSPGSRKALWSLQTHFAFLPSAPIRRIPFHSRQPRWPGRALYMPPINQSHTAIQT